MPSCLNSNLTCASDVWNHVCASGRLCIYHNSFFLPYISIICMCMCVQVVLGSTPSVPHPPGPPHCTPPHFTPHPSHVPYPTSPHPTLSPPYPHLTLPQSPHPTPLHPTSPYLTPSHPTSPLPRHLTLSPLPHSPYHTLYHPPVQCLRAFFLEFMRYGGCSEVQRFHVTSLVLPPEHTTSVMHRHTLKS